MNGHSLAESVQGWEQRIHVVIINGFLQIPEKELGILNIFKNWIINNYGELNLFSKEDFKKELIKAGAVNIKFTVNNGILFGYGSKPFDKKEE